MSTKSNRKGHDALVKSYEEYIKQGESGKAVTNSLIDAVMHMLIGPARLARIKNIEEQRVRIREAYRNFEENHGTGKLYLNDLIAAMANYMLDNEIPKQRTGDDDDDEDDEDFELINIREPASMGRFYEPPPLKIDDVEAYRQRARISAGLVFYNDIEVIRRCLESLKDFDLVICIDGRYDIANGLPLSTDGSREVVKSFDNTLLVDMPFRQQTDLRNMYLDEAVWNDCDYLLVIEADEYVTGDMEAFRMNLPVITDESDDPDSPYIARATDVVYNIPMHYVGQNHVVKSPRFFCRPHLIRYGGTHSTYIVNGYQFLARNGNESDSFVTLPDITVNHDERPRTAAQEKRAQKYQKRLVAQEKAERTALKKAGRVL